MRSVIINTTPLIALSNINHLELLHKLYSKVIIPQAVFDEIRVKQNSACYHALKSSDWIEVMSIQNVFAKEFYRTQLHNGEVEVMILSKEQHADLVIIDDHSAKRHAKHLGLNVVGTLGVLIRSKELGYIDKIEPLVEEMVEKGFYLSEAVKMLVLKSAGEQ